MGIEEAVATEVAPEIFDLFAGYGAEEAAATYGTEAAIGGGTAAAADAGTMDQFLAESVDAGAIPAGTTAADVTAGVGADAASAAAYQMAQIGADTGIATTVPQGMMDAAGQQIANGQLTAMNFASGGMSGLVSDTSLLSDMGGANGLNSANAASSFGNVSAPSSWSDIAKSALMYGGPALSIGSALYGANQSSKLRSMAGQGQTAMAKALTPIPGQPSVPAAAAAAQATADPWGTSGGRSLADTQLQAFLRNPNPAGAGTGNEDPAFAARIQGAQRSMGSYGQDSGNMAVAGANASTDWYNQRLAQLANLAGAPGNPGVAAQLGLSGQTLGQNQQELQLRAAQGGASNNLAMNTAANDLMGKSLASAGYGATMLAGGNTQFTPAMLEALRKAGINFTGAPA